MPGKLWRWIFIETATKEIQKPAVLRVSGNIPINRNTGREFNSVE
jgi:hypothetical protein